MLVNGYIKKIMHMGREISKIKITEKREDKYVIITVWEQQTIPPPPPPPPPKLCTTCQTSCEGTSQCTCQSGESCLQQCGNCLSLCQNNQGSDM